MTRPFALLVAALVAVAMSGCGAPTFRHGPDDGSGPREGFSAHQEEDAPTDGGEGDAGAEEETFVDDESVDFDAEEGPYEEVE